jgi:hypothetical protein
MKRQPNYPSRLTSSSDLSGVVLLLFEGTGESLLHTVFADLGIGARDDNAFDMAGSANCAGLLVSVHGVGAMSSSDVGVLNRGHGVLVVETVVVLRSNHGVVEIMEAHVLDRQHSSVLRQSDGSGTVYARVSML